MTKEEYKILAKEICEKEFLGKFDKGGNPYIKHCEFVAENSAILYKSVFGDLDDLYIIGLLHDLVEDCECWSIDIIQKIFGDDIATAIKLLTKTKGCNEEQYINAIKQNEYARAVKLADLQNNMDITRLKTITEKDIQRIQKYHKYYRFLLED